MSLIAVFFLDEELIEGISWAQDRKIVWGLLEGAAVSGETQALHFRSVGEEFLSRLGNRGEHHPLRIFAADLLN